MAITSTQQIPGSLGAQFSSGSYLDDAASPASATITLGYKPREVVVDNVTDRVKIVWYHGMSETAGASVKTAATGVRTLETVGITVTSTGFTISNNATLAVLLQNKQLRWNAKG